MSRVCVYCSKQQIMEVTSSPFRFSSVREDVAHFKGDCYEEVDVDVDRFVAYTMNAEPKVVSADEDRAKRGSRGTAPPSCRCWCVVTLVAAVGLLLAAAALGLALADFLELQNTTQRQANASLDDSMMADYSSSATIIAELSFQISELQEGLLAARKTIQELEDGLRVLGRELNHSISSTSSQIQELSLQLEALNTTALTNSAPADTSLPASSYPALLYNLSTYQNCSTSRDADCTVYYVALGDPPYSVCETGSVPIKAEGLHTQDAVCVVTDRGGEGNPVVTSLDMNTDSNTMRCSCFVIALSQRTAPVSCALSVTRCPETDNYSANLHHIT